MKLLRAACLAVCLCTAVAKAETPCTPSDKTVCLPQADFQRFLDIAVERQCLEQTKPVFHLDSVVVTTDAEGRVFYSGSDPKKPYTLKMSWCNYEVQATGNVDLVAAMKVPQTAGLRFRPKAYLGYLPLKLSKGGRFESGVDAGLLIDWLYVDWANLNVAAGFRSVGLGVGADLSTNFGVYAGYALGWTQPVHNLNASIYFAF